MPFYTKIRDALLAPLGVVRASHLTAIEERYSYILLPGENAADFVPNTTQSISFNGRLFSRDDADTTTPHDGILCIVTSGGVRFKSDTLGNGAITRRYAVLDILATPPVSPVVGASYLVDVGGAGAWATRDKQISTWTGAGWKFVVPKTYDEAHVADELQIYHYNGSSVWVAGISAIVLADSTVSFAKLKHGLGQAVENSTTNTPPVSPSEGVAYIIGGSPTGAWVGQALKLAIYTNSAWVFFAPQIGWKVFDKSTNADVVYTASGWASLISGYSSAVSSAISNTSDLSITGSYAYLPSSAPTTAAMTLIASLAYTPKKAGVKIEVEASIKSINGTSLENTGACALVSCFGLFLDGGATAVDWAMGPSVHQSIFNGGSSFDISSPSSFHHSFEWTSTDTSNHTFKIYGSRFATSGGNPLSCYVNRTKIAIRERA